MPEHLKLYFFGFVIAFLLLGLFILLLAALYSKKQQKNKNERLIMQGEFQQELFQTQIEIQEQTLKNISQEIHDNIGQVLSLAKINLHTLQSNEQEKLQDTKQLVSKALNDLRDLSRSMHGDRISEIGLQEAIESELKILQNMGQLKTSLSIEGESFKIESKKEMIVFRILQESLNNAVKHSQASNVLVSIHYAFPAFAISITDDGQGFSPELLKCVQKGIGLKSMNNRAALIGATYAIDSHPGKGTTISVAF